MAANDENERAKVNASYLLGRGIRQVGQVLNTPRFEDTSPPVNIYAEGSPTERAQRAQGLPGAAIAATAVDAAALIPRAGLRVSQNIYRGATGQAPVSEPFVMNPTTRWALAGGPQTRNAAEQSSQVSASPPATSGFRPNRAAPAMGRTSPDVGPTSEPTFTTAPSGEETITQAGYDAAHRQLAAADATAKAEGRPTTAEVNAAGMRWLGEQLTQRGNGASGGGASIAGQQEALSGAPGGSTPALKTPFVDPEQFKVRTGWDKEGNPVYTSGAQEMAAANAGITDYNTALMRGYEARNAAFAAEQGTIPENIAQAGLVRTQAAELPGENKSLQGLRAAQTAQLERTKLTPLTVDVPVGPPNQLGEVPTIRRQMLYNQDTGETIDPLASGLRPEGTVKSAINALSADQRSVVTKHFGERTDVTPSEVLEYIKTLSK